jgi:glutathione peroxidase
MTPTGPTGTAITMPTAMPFSRNTKSNLKSRRCSATKGALCYSALLQTFEPPEVAMTDTDDAYQFEFVSIDGERLPLEAWRGRPVLVVNTASFCGYTPQYSDLEALWQRYRDRGLVVLGVPSNDFGRQEPGSTGQIKEFCTTNYSVDFPLTEKCWVIGGEAHPFYRWIAESLGEAGAPRWNFHKYLVGPEGQLAGAWPAQVSPSDRRITGEIERLLPQPSQ